MHDPPAPESSRSLAARRSCSLAARRSFALAAAALGLALAACAGGDAPWDVEEGEEARFRRAQRECRILTQDASGEEGPISFDRCMGRRGFQRKGPIERWLEG